jgi:hypothetical protein
MQDFRKWAWCLIMVGVFMGLSLVPLHAQSARSESAKDPLLDTEALWNEKDALSLLATHVVDEAAGEAFFGDPMRMHRDLLADAARAYLDAHPLAP